MSLCLLQLAHFSFWCVCLYCKPSPIALLFFPIDIFVLVNGFVLSTTSLLFFLMDLFELYVLSGGVLFFPLGLSVFVLFCIISPFFFPMGLFVFQISGLVTPMGMYIFMVSI